jgi:hypothetical protein
LAASLRQLGEPVAVCRWVDKTLVDTRPVGFRQRDVRLGFGCVLLRQRREVLLERTVIRGGPRHHREMMHVDGSWFRSTFTGVEPCGVLGSGAKAPLASCLWYVTISRAAAAESVASFASRSQ